MLRHGSTYLRRQILLMMKALSFSIMCVNFFWATFAIIPPMTVTCRYTIFIFTLHFTSPDFFAVHVHHLLSVVVISHHLSLHLIFHTESFMEVFLRLVQKLTCSSSRLCCKTLLVIMTNNPLWLVRILALIYWVIWLVVVQVRVLCIKIGQRTSWLVVHSEIVILGATRDLSFLVLLFSVVKY